MRQVSYTTAEARQSLEMLHDVASRAMNALAELEETRGLARAAADALSLIAASRGAVDAGDPTEAVRVLEEARDATKRTYDAAKGGKGERQAPPLGTAIELLEQALSAMDQVKHRIRNAASRHLTFGAIRTPRSERMA